MNDRLEKFITENRNDFDSLESPAGMWEKINESVQQKKKTAVKSYKWKQVLWRAAAVLVIFCISFLISEMIHRNDTIIVETEQAHEYEQPPELIEAEAYYTSRVNKRLLEIDKYLTGNPELKLQVNYDINELDSIYQELKNDLQENYNNQEVIEAMIQNYRLKLQILNEVLELLKKIEDPSHNKSNNHEI